jgi:hypothetical protein
LFLNINFTFKIYAVMVIEEIVRQIVESRKCYIEELQTITSNPSVRMPNNLKIDTLLSEVEQSYKIFDNLKSEVDKNLKRVSKAKKINFIDEKIKEIRGKYDNYNTEESIIDWPLNILAYRLIEGNYDLDLKYFAGQLVYNFWPGKNYGYQFEKELKGIALGVAEHKLLLELESEFNDLLKGNSSRIRKSENSCETEDVEDLKRNIRASIKIEIQEYFLPELFEGLRPYFDEKQHSSLYSVLSGKNVKHEPLVLKKVAAKKLLEVFRRLSYNDCITENKKIVTQWIEHHFAYTEIRDSKNRGKIMKMSRNYITNCLSKSIGDIRKEADRICNFEKLPYKNLTQLAAEQRQ